MKQLPYDIDGTDILNIPLNPKTCFESSKDDRPLSNLMRNKRSGFKGYRFMTKFKGSFQCSNPHCANRVQYNWFNRRQLRLREFARVLAICVKDKRAMQGKT